MSKLLRDQFRVRDPRLADWTSVMVWLENLGPTRMRNALPKNLVDSPTHQVHVGHTSREWENEGGAGMRYHARVVVRIGAVVVYRQSQLSRAAYETGEARNFEHVSESVFVAVPPDAVIIKPRKRDGDSDFFELNTSQLTEVTEKDGPWCEVLLKELRPYLNEKRRYESAAAAERERGRVSIERKEAERLRAAAEAVHAPRPLQRENSALTATRKSSNQLVSSQPHSIRVFTAVILFILGVVAVIAVLSV